MKIDRITRINELLRREIGEVIYRLIDPSTFDLAALTVTHVITSPDLRSARVLVSIRGHENERDRMLSQLQRLHGAIQEDIAKKVILKYTPKIQFDMDHSIENGDKVLSLLAQLDQSNHPDASPEPSEET